MHRILKVLLEAFVPGGPGFVPLVASASGVPIPEDKFIQIVTPTWVSSGNILILPSPTPCKVVILAGAATGGNVQSNAPATVAINGGTGAGVKSAVAANQLVVLIAESSTSWKAFTIASNGTVAGLAAAS